MSHPARLVLAAILALTITAHGLQAQSDQPVVHLLAPSYEALQRHDALVAETALRLLAMDLAANHGIYAKYWPIDQQGSLPDTAYPRITLKAYSAPRMGHLRLTRTGNVFTISKSFDGKYFFCQGHYTMDLPSKAHVGVYLHSRYTEEEASTVVSNVRLNGEPFGDGVTIGDLGECRRPGEVERDGDTWSIRTYGYAPNEAHPDSGVCDHGTFISVEHEGDFVLDANVKRIDPKESWAFAGLMCRSGLTCDAPAIGAYRQGHGWSGGMLRNRSYAMKQWLFDPGTHTVGITLLSSNGKQKELGYFAMSCGCWDALVRSADDLSVALGMALMDKLDLDIGENRFPAEEASLEDDSSAALDEARSLALTVHEGNILAASRKLDSILNMNPRSAEAHYTAALCGSILACHDLYGGFHERPRYLAGPFAHWLLARRLDKAKRAEDMMSGAWLMLACGYPNAALSVAQSLPEDEQESPEVRALKIFVTRDYRRPENDSILHAPPIEQLAWLWASQECGNDTPLRSAPIRMAMARKSSAFLPMYDTADVGPGHTSTVLGMSLAYGTDVFNLLANAGLPDSDCKTIARDIAQTWNLPPEDEVKKIASDVWTATVARGQDDDAVAESLPPLMALYAAACRQPVGPVPNEKGFAWRCLPLHDYADILRGRFLRLLHIRAYFIGNWWGVPEYGNEFCTEVAEGLASMPDASDYFRSMALRFVDKNLESKSLCDKLLDRPFGRNPVVMRRFSNLWVPPETPINRLACWLQQNGRGSWDWSNLSWVASKYDYDTLQEAMAFIIASVDDYSTSAMQQLYWLALAGPAGTPEPGMTFFEHMPYNLSILRSIASGASRLEKQDLAIQLNEKLIDIAPDDTGAYRRLAWLYEQDGKRAKGIEVLKSAFENCEHNVQLTNLMGLCARWLADENQLDEALALGEQASHSYSYSGLHGYAYALAANGMIDKAFQVYRAMAHRYDSGADELLGFLFKNDYSDDEILVEIEALLEEHKNMKDTVKEGILTGFRRHSASKEDLFEKALAGPLAVRNRTQIQREILCYHMCTRSWPEAMRGIGEMMAAQRKQIADMITCYMVALMSGDDSNREYFKKFTQRRTTSDMYDATIGLIDERLTPEEALEQSKSDYDKLYTYLLIGITAEQRGDLAAAREAYENGAQVHVSARGRDVAARWAAHLKDVESGKVQYIGPEHDHEVAQPKPGEEGAHQEETSRPAAKEKRAPALPLIAGGIVVILLLVLGGVLWLKRSKCIS